MANTMMFTIPGEPSVDVTVTEVLNAETGFIELRFDLVLDEAVAQGDLRGLFFDVSDESLLAGLSVSGDDVTRSSFAANRVTDLGQGNNMNGAITARGKGFDAGVSFGTPGIGKDDIDSTSFTLASASGDLDLDLVGLMRFGARLTSVGPEGNREDSLKLVGTAPQPNRPPLAEDDAASTDEDTAVVISVLGNDSDPDGDAISVVGFTQATNGTVVDNGDGTFTYTPFQDYNGSDSFAYTISDGVLTSTATVNITIDPVNDAPLAKDDGKTADDRIIVESGDTVTADLLANDTDVDSAIDPDSVVISAGTLGTVGMAAGVMSYTANDLQADPANGTGIDTLSYTVADVEGAVSNAAEVLVHVIDPLAETGQDSAAAALNGQLISLTMTTEDRTFNDESEVAVRIDFGALDQPDVNVSFVWDGSGSISLAEYSAQLQSIQIGINQLRALYDGTGADVEVQLVQFSGQGNGVPVTQAFREGRFDLFDTALNNIAALSSITTQIRQTTNYEVALDRAVDFFDPQSGEANFLFFISDGLPNVAVNPTTPSVQQNNSNPAAYLDEVDELNDAGVSITAIGFGDVQLATLNAIDNTGGAQVFTNPNQIAAAIEASPLFPADVIEFSLEVNGVDQGLDASDLVALGGGSLGYDGQIFGLDNSLGAMNTFVATAGFDVDGDGIVDEVRTVTNIVDGTDGSDVFMFV